MLEGRNICKQYGHTKALSQASLVMKPGEIRALLGSNGSGKSTMAKVLGGLVGNQEGVISIQNKPVQIHSAKDALDRGIALAYQDYSLVDQLTVEENLFLNIRIADRYGFIDLKKRRECTLHILERFHINVQPDTYVGLLGESDKSLLEVAKALAYHPRFLILDEVTACLHRDQVLRLFGILRDEKEQGLSILFISHRMDEVFELCETVTIFRNGKTVIETDLVKLSHEDILFYMTGERDVSHQKAPKNEVESRGEAVLTIKDLYVGNQVRNVSLNLFAGEILGVCGLQGQGQGEFLRAVYGCRKDVHGTILYKGKAMQKGSPEKSLKSGMAFISGDRQSEGIFADRSIFENINISKAALRFIFQGIEWKKSQLMADQLVKKLHVVIGELSDPASSLSGGNQQKLVFARNLLFDLSVLLLDDPTKGVDVKSRKEIQDILKGLSEKGMACIYYSSDYKELTAISDRIVVFYEGKITEEFDEVSEKIESDLAAAMLGTSKEQRGKEYDEAIGQT